MKSIKEIINQNPVFLNSFEDARDVFIQFEGAYSDEEKSKSIEKHSNEKILFASYGCESYEGSAWLLFENDGKIFEINGSHCSCYGLEDQWDPEEVFLEALEHRIKEGSLGEDSYSGNNFKNELIEFLGLKNET